MRRYRIDVGRDHVGLDLVAQHVRAAARTRDGIEHVEQVKRLLTLSEHRVGNDGPGRGVCVLAAVLADARRIALDIAGVERRVLERRREQQREAGLALDQRRLDGSHGFYRARGLGGLRDHAPGLRDRIDAALGARRGSERRAVIEIAAPVPVPVPSVALERAA